MWWVLSDIYNLISDERCRQDQKWSNTRELDPKLWMTVMMEEVGEVARAVLEDDKVNLEEELIQVAAVAVAWLEQHHREKRLLNV